MLPRKKEDMSKEEMYKLTEEKIKSIKADIHLFTDGSTSGKQENGGAGVFIQNAETGEEIYSAMFPAGKWCSSYGGESIAMREAVKWIRQSGQPSRKYLIATDSRSLLDAIKANDWKDEDPVLNEIKEEIKQNEADITILWVPSHCGTAGNEKADKIADEARQLDQQTTKVSRKIVRAKKKGKKWEITHPRAKETCMERRAP